MWGDTEMHFDYMMQQLTLYETGSLRYQKEKVVVLKKGGAR